MKALEFKKPDYVKFPCLKLAMDAARAGHSAQVVLNAANEVMVAGFLAGEVRFTDIPKGVGAMLEHHNAKELNSVEEVLSLDNDIRRQTEEWIRKTR